MITAKDITDMAERVDAKLLPLCDYEGFEPYEGIYRLGDYGYVTETEYNAAFKGEPYWAQDAYMLEGNGVGCDSTTTATLKRCPITSMSVSIMTRWTTFSTLKPLRMASVESPSCSACGRASRGHSLSQVGWFYPADSPMFHALRR